MRVLIVFLSLLWAVNGWCGQPSGVRLDANGLSFIYPVFDTADWVITQPEPTRMYMVPDSARITHWSDEYYAQDWARGCGQTFGHRLFAGISGQVVMAGIRGPYGYTVAIYDQPSGFVLKYSHLSEVSVVVGEYVLAGKSFIGRVGNTGNVQSSGCSSHSGAHLHLALFKNVADPNARPVSTTNAASGGGPTAFAAPFSYTTSHELMKTANDPTVYVAYYGTRVPVSYASFVSHGWNFDRYQSLFRPLANRIVSTGQLNQVEKAHYFWPARDQSLLKASYTPTVYVFEDGQKRALDYQTFNCRGYRFGEVVEIPVGERDQYAPLNDIAATGCASVLRQTLNDWRNFAAKQGFSKPNWASYFYRPDWDPNWELRTLEFKNSAGQSVNLQISVSLSNSTERYIGFHEPGTGNWNGWHRVR